MLNSLKVKYRMRQLEKQVRQFYKEAIFIPAPSIINLYDTECIAKIIDDMTLLGENKNLIQQLIDLD